MPERCVATANVSGSISFLPQFALCELLCNLRKILASRFQVHESGEKHSMHLSHDKKIFSYDQFPAHITYDSRNTWRLQCFTSSIRARSESQIRRELASLELASLSVPSAQGVERSKLEMIETLPRLDTELLIRVVHAVTIPSGSNAVRRQSGVRFKRI